MNGYKSKHRTKMDSLVFAVLIVIFTAGIGFCADERAYAGTAYDGGNRSEGFLDRAWKFIGNMANIFVEEEEIERKAESEIVGEVQESAETNNVDYMRLVNAYNPVEREYKPEEMVNVADYVAATKNSVYLEKQAAENYINLVNAMKADGITGVAAVSGYRDYDYQTRLHNAEIEKQKQYYSANEARKKAARIVAAPGTSEHQIGLAIDISSKDIGYALSGRFADTASFAWIRNHAHEYGFIVRYAKDKTDITGVIYEPWHLRYVGGAAAEIYESGLCLEEYIAAD